METRSRHTEASTKLITAHQAHHCDDHARSQSREKVSLPIRNDIETTETHGHSNITGLYHSPSLWRHERHSTHNERQRARKVPKVPSRRERGESSSNGVAQRPLDPCQRLRTRRARTRRAQAPASGSGTSSISRPKSDRGRTKLQHPAAAPLVHSGWTLWMFTAIPAQASRSRREVLSGSGL